MLIKRSALPHFVKLSRNFDLAELFCKCGECQNQKIDPLMLHMLQQLRNIVLKPVAIRSFYRCRVHNTRVGGSPRSAHLDGMGADIGVNLMSGIDLARAALQVGFKRIGVAEHWCHVDVKPTSKDLVVWTYDGLVAADIRKILMDDLKDT